MNKSYSLGILLFLRLLLFVAFQGIIALCLLAMQHSDAWYQSQSLWIISGLLTNIITFFILNKLFKLNGERYFSNFKFIKKGWWLDILILLGALLISMPLSTYPNTSIASWLYGNSETAIHLMFRPVPIWVVVLGFVWAITQGLVELPYYFAYIMPRLTEKLKNGWTAWLIASLLLALQHIALPFIFDWKFWVWRFGMFLLFALFLGFCIKLRPRLLPYFMIMHALLDMGAVAVFLTLK